MTHEPLPSYDLEFPSAPEATISRRRALDRIACGFGSMALASLLGGPAARGASPASTPSLPPRARRVIFLFMQGGPSHVDTFDHKPRLEREHGREVKFRVARSRQVTPERVMKSPWSFAHYGVCGHPVSELFPEVAHHVDDLCFVHGMRTEGVAHGPATLFLHTGATQLVRPSMGAWISYGLGTENRDLPAFVTIQPSLGNGGPRNYASAFLPPVHQGTPLGRAGTPGTPIAFGNVTRAGSQRGTPRDQLDLIQSLNRAQAERAAGGGRVDDAIEAAIDSFELAFRMQTAAPVVTDLAGESAATLTAYGIGEKETDDFGRQCLLARRFAEAGVRYVQVNYADNGDNPRWDQHSEIEQHAVHARAVDKPIAGLLADLKSRGLLHDTLVWWGGEFGRNPFAQDHGTGRDHNPDGFTHWLAGGGVRAGFSFGETDEFGHTAVVDPVHMHDLHATILHLLGLDHERLTFRFAGRDFRLTDVHGHVVHEIIA